MPLPAARRYPCPFDRVSIGGGRKQLALLSGNLHGALGIIESVFMRVSYQKIEINVSFCSVDIFII